MMKIVKKLKGNRFWSSVASLSAGQIIAQAINMISIPIISRVYSKEAYGDFGLVISAATIIIGFIGLGLGSAIMAADSNEESEKVLRSCFFLQLGLSTVICAMISIIGIKYRLYNTQLPYYLSILVMYLYINLSIHSSLMNVYINRLGENKVLLINPMIGAFSTLAITLPLGIAGWDSIGLYAANIVSLTLVNIHMLRHHSPYKKRFHFQDIYYVVNKFKHFVIYQYPSNLMGTFSMQMPTQIIANSFGISALGDYSMTNRVFGIPLSVIAQPIQTVYFRTVTERIRNNEDIAGLTYSLVTKIMMAAFVPLVIGVSFAEPIFSFVLGSQWNTAGYVASILAFPFLFNFCYSCVTYCRVAIGKQKVNLVVTILHVVSTILALLAGVYGFGSFVGTVICFSIVETLYNIFNLTMNFWCLKQNVRKFVSFVSVYLVCCIALIILIKFISGHSIG